MLNRSVSCFTDNNYNLHLYTIHASCVFCRFDTTSSSDSALCSRDFEDVVPCCERSFLAFQAYLYINGIKWHQTVTLLTFLHSCTAKGYPRQCSKWSPIWCVLVPEGDVTSVAGNVGAHLHGYHPQLADTPRSVNSASAVSWHEGKWALNLSKIWSLEDVVQNVLVPVWRVVSVRFVFYFLQQLPNVAWQTFCNLTRGVGLHEPVKVKGLFYECLYECLSLAVYMAKSCKVVSLRHRGLLE